MKWVENISKGDKHYKWLFISIFHKQISIFFVSKMSIEESLMEKLQQQYLKKLQKLKEEQERLEEH